MNIYIVFYIEYHKLNLEKYHAEIKSHLLYFKAYINVQSFVQDVQSSGNYCTSLLSYCITLDNVCLKVVECENQHLSEGMF